jgi:DNA invertase Pin-like site-specific DNA recombinase
MFTSEKITKTHLTRTAIIYIRQSTPHQVLNHQESLKLQYALRERALSLGWRNDDIEIVDSDLGLTAATAQFREGFKDLFAKVSLGQIGIILSTEVTRLARNCTDWYPLLDICGFNACLIADRDGIYNPAIPNDRLLLGLKGTLSEMELHTIKTRMHAGLINKAQRGELALQLPIGLLRDNLGRVSKHTSREVQHRIDLVFQTFLQLRTASNVLRHFNQQQLTLPRRDNLGDVVWKQPNLNSIISVLKNPAYAGAFAYGKTRSAPRGSSPHPHASKRLPIADWKILLHDKYPAYVSWEIFEKIQAMLQDNHAEYDRHKTRGIARAGAALLHGLVFCAECGHKMMVQYKPTARYVCRHLNHKYGAPICQNISADPVDAQVIKAFFQALSPIELDLYQRALAEQQQIADQARQAQQQQIERLRYQANLAERQFNRVDPDNRLVASELEARWETALRELRQAEATASQAQQALAVPLVLSPELKAAFSDIGESLPQIWEQNLLSPEQKKSFLRCLIEKIALHRVTPDQLQARIIWAGGQTTTLSIPMLVASFAALSASKEMETQIIELATAGVSDQEIASTLTAQGHRSPRQQFVLPDTVKRVRLKHGILHNSSQSHPRQITGFLTVAQLAKVLDVSPHFIHDRIHNGVIEIAKDKATGLYLFPDKPATIKQFKKMIDGRLHNLRF